MTLDVSQLLLFGIFCSALHWLIARSEITKPFWSRTHGVLAALLACAGCSGFWIGGILGGAGLTAPLVIDVSPILYVDVALRALVHGVLGIFVTPVFEAVLLWGLGMSAIEVDDEPGAVPQKNTDSVDTPVSNPRRQP